MNKYSGDKIQEIELSGACSTYGGEKGYIRVLVGKQERTRPLGRYKGSLEDNIKNGLSRSQMGSWTGLI
jgi:hypothetical protein